jgi:hypothetical protein
LNTPIIRDELRQLRTLIDNLISYIETIPESNRVRDPELLHLYKRAVEVRAGRVTGRGKNEYAVTKARKARVEKAREHRRKILAFTDSIGKGYGFDDIRFMVKELNHRADMASMSGRPWTVVMLQRLILKEQRVQEAEKEMADEGNV